MSGLRHGYLGGLFVLMAVIMTVDRNFGLALILVIVGMGLTLAAQVIENRTGHPRTDSTDAPGL